MKVLHLGAVSLLPPIPFVVGYCVGFVLGAITRPRGLTAGDVDAGRAAGEPRGSTAAKDDSPLVDQAFTHGRRR